MKIETVRHSFSHILAHAVQELYPGAKFGIGPAIENGFYYDFDLNNPLSPQDLPKIEKKMREIIRQGVKFKKKFVTKREARKIFKSQPYKLELIKEIKGDKVTVYESGNFTDLCAGPHAKSTEELNPDAFKLTKVAGAYWKGSEENKMLQRIYGVAFSNKKDLDEYLRLQAEAEKRDHRLLGQKLDIFHIDEKFGAGLPLWHPKGAILRKTIESYLVEEQLKNGYQIVATPHVAHLSLWKTTGHWNFYRENLFPPMKLEGEDYLVKPMNCPGHILIYQTQLRSYNDLPLRYFELGTVYRFEKSGVLHGLTRVRGFTQDDAHIFCTPDQLSEELVSILKLGLGILKEFGFKDYDVYLSTRPEKYVGTPGNWKKATSSLKYALEKVGLKYQVDPGEGVFYGPKIDIKIKDSLGRAWQCTTLQVDFNVPERMQVTYIDQKGKKQQPIMIHRALVGSLERFIGVLLEHYAGALPLWLSPEQIWVVPIGEGHRKYARQIAEKIESAGFRVKVKEENETMGRKIREGEIQKIPYILIVGDEEIKNETVGVRKRGKGNTGAAKLEKFLKDASLEVENKA
ncbi:MAG: threonine--tRNA ligase [Candidatus Pacebacteria bacterium]|jgi:threonyl-tRNA synthetase|nr:threonine--tRNA ligase [Candidatus Paceibacterota bacterium]